MISKYKETVRDKFRAAMDDRIAEIVRKSFRCEDLIFHSILSSVILSHRNGRRYYVSR